MRIFLLPLLALVPALATAALPDSREFEFLYRVEITAPKDGAPMEVFLPLAVSDEFQEVKKPVIRGPLTLNEEKEPKYGNRYLHGTLDGRIPLGHVGPFVIELRYRVKRAIHKNIPVDGPAAGTSSDTASAELALFLGPDKRVPSSGPLIERMISDLAFKKTDNKAARARRIYDFVVDTMDYKKTGKGWGNGDTEWACTQKYGNCTDFHALFSSLARHEGIPSRFEIGFSIPEDQKSGDVGGYHCWVNFYLPGSGWIPIDASEAKKHPAKRDLLFGTHPPDRVKFSVGRDLRLSAVQKSEPLNFFVYPHIEKDGKKYEAVRTHFEFREL